MLGTWINVFAIIVGSIIGLFLKKGLSKSLQDSLMQALGLVTLVIGLSSALKSEIMFLVVVSLVIGTIFGELIDIDEKLVRLGDLLESKVKSSDSNISVAFVSTSILYCVGAMAIIGSLESAIQNNHQTLITKSILDGISSIIFTSSMGIGVIFSSVSVLVYQGTITLFAQKLAGFISDPMIVELSAVGGVMILGIGLNMLKLTKIKIANLLPALLVPIVYFIFIV